MVRLMSFEEPEDFDGMFCPHCGEDPCECPDPEDDWGTTYADAEADARGQDDNDRDDVDICPDCDGSGEDLGTVIEADYEPCPTCGGRGILD